MSAAKAIQGTTGAAWWPADLVEIDRNTKTIRAALDEESYASAQEAGRNTTLEQAVEFAFSYSQSKFIRHFPQRVGISTRENLANESVTSSSVVLTCVVLYDGPPGELFFFFLQALCLSP